MSTRTICATSSHPVNPSPERSRASNNNGILNAAAHQDGEEIQENLILTGGDGRV